MKTLEIIQYHKVFSTIKLISKLHIYIDFQGFLFIELYYFPRFSIHLVLLLIAIDSDDRTSFLNIFDISFHDIYYFRFRHMRMKTCTGKAFKDLSQDNINDFRDVLYQYTNNFMVNENDNLKTQVM